MREMRLVIKREFLERVRTKGFLISTFLFPILLIGLYSLPFLIKSEGKQRELVLVDEAPAGVADRVIASLTAPRTDAKANSYQLTRVAGPFEAQRAALNTRVQQEEIYGYIVLPADVVESSRVLFRARNISNTEILQDIDGAVTRAVQAERLRARGLDPAEASSIVRSVHLDAMRITAKGTEGGTPLGAILLSFVLTFLTYMLILIYGMNVMRSVMEEKTNRIAEVMVSSIRSSHLMAGKIIGVGSVALLQVGIWAAFVGVAATQSRTIAAQLGVSPEILKAVTIAPSTLAAFLGFFILGFFLYASLFAAVGAAMTNEQEAQGVQTFIIMPLAIPLMLSIPMAGEPMGTLATTLGLVPLTSPITMPMLMANAEIPTTQVLGSLGILLVSLLLVSWIAGKIYRIGILSTGKKPTMKELARWLKAA